MRNNFQKNDQPLYKKLLRYLAIGVILLALGLFFDWLIFNWMLGCCEGGVCWPDIYPQCRNSHYGEFYGNHH